MRNVTEQLDDLYEEDTFSVELKRMPWEQTFHSLSIWCFTIRAICRREMTSALETDTSNSSDQQTADNL
jgi:hypothetical protein